MTTTYKFKASYTKNGIGAAPSAATVCTVVDSDDNVLADADVVTVLSNLPGVCLYSYTGADGLDLIALFHTSDNTVDQQDLYSYTPDILTRYLNATVASRATLGTGAIPYTPDRAVDPDDNPLDGVDTWINTDGANSTIGVLARASTNSLGLINPPFMLDAGTYYVWRQLGGYSFSNPETVVVS